MHLDRRHFAGALSALLALPAAAQSARRSTVVTHAPTELAWVLAGLSPLGRNGDSLHRDNPYWHAAEDWFAPFAQHRAVIALGADFNLPRLIGNAANYEFDQSGRLVRSPSGRPMWNDVRGDLFTRHRRAIDAFARESQARTFLAEQRATLENVCTTLADAVDLADMQSWLELQFLARPAPMEVFVSPVTGGWNFTNLDPVTPRLWVPAIDPPKSNYARFAAVRSIFTEMDHNYVNPATYRLDSSVFAFMTAANGWATAEAWSDYGSCEATVNEYMTFAAFLAYAEDRITGEDLARIETATLRMMERRGFPRFSDFADMVRRERKHGDTLESIYPAVLAAIRG